MSSYELSNVPPDVRDNNTKLRGSCCTWRTGPSSLLPCRRRRRTLQRRTARLLLAYRMLRVRDFEPAFSHSSSSARNFSERRRSYMPAKLGVLPPFARWLKSKQHHKFLHFLANFSNWPHRNEAVPST